ncbi:glycoside hydrolase family 3 protein [Hydnum rufescens UP504]|uniref:beta-glucosidase n=1 Tax=Hydnum rufescens UP504 TaxID=1448309 RepID=A0A9P6B120_9AGAM|nr:glycoside hydrolase family 3 protein [Hydnum rufescens UP504]
MLPQLGTKPSCYNKAKLFIDPAMAVTRAPEAGRQWESFGVDSYLTGEAVYATVVGVQSTGVQACAKHFIGNQQESFRYSNPFPIPTSPLIGETGLLKGQLGFKGYVVSYWGGTHRFAMDNTAAGRASSSKSYAMPGDWILIGGGVLCIVVDTMLTRMLTSYFHLSQDQGFPAIAFNVQSSSTNSHVNAHVAAHTALIRIIGGASAVLLKNLNSTLPLVSLDDIAVVGPNAGPDVGFTLNACDADCMTCLTGSDVVQMGIGDKFAQVNATIAAGHAATLTTSISNDLADCSRINAVATINKNTIVVIHTVGPVMLEAWIENPNDLDNCAVTAIINAGLPGVQSGSSIVDLSWDTVNPSGRLPHSIAKSSSDFPAREPTSSVQKSFNSNLASANTLSFDANLFSDITYTEGLFTDYMYFDAQNITPATKTRAGTEVVQLYVGFPSAAGEPPKLLRGFEVVDLALGVQSIVTFPLVEGHQGYKVTTIFVPKMDKYHSPSMKRNREKETVDLNNKAQ